MSPIKNSLTVLMLTILLRMGTSVSLLERLLETTLRTASCQARCDGLSMEDLQDCLEICDLVTRNSRSSICEFPRFCTGGCRAACSTGEEGERASLTSLSQQDCEVSWQVQSSHRAVYVVVGQDRTGMYSLVSGLEQGTSLRLSPALSTKYLELTVLAVDRKGLSDRKSLALQSVTECRHTAEPPSDHQVTVQKLETFYESHSVLMGVLTLVTVLITVSTVLAFIYRRGRGRTNSGGDNTCHNDKAFLLSREDFLYHDQLNTEIYTFF